MKKWIEITAFLVVIAGLSGCSNRSQAKSEPLDEKAQIQYQFASEAYEKGDLIPALSSTLEALKTSPHNPEAKNLLGLIYFRQRKYAEAEQAFLGAIASDSHRSEFHNNLGTLYYEMKAYDKALKSLQQALVNPLYMYPERIHNNLGLVNEALGRLEEAKSNYLESIRLRKDFYLPYQNLGKLYLDEGNKERAKVMLSEAVKNCVDCAEPRYHLGILLKEKSLTEAMKLFKQGAQLDPNGYYGRLCRDNLTMNSENR